MTADSNGDMFHDIPGVESALPAGVQDDIDVLRWRRRVGYLLGGLSIVAIAGALYLTLSSIDRLPEPNSGKEPFAYLKLAAHAVVFVAWVWFCYQLLRASERMVLPYWWLRQNVEAVRLLLGVSDPWRASVKLGKELLEMSGKAGQQAAGILDAGSDHAGAGSPQARS